MAARKTFPRAIWLKIVLCSGMLSGLLLSHHLWLSTRFYPLTPVWSKLPPIHASWDAVFFGALIGLLVLIAVVPKPRPWMIAAIILCLLLCAEDQSRWQPWFYQYLLMLGALTVFPWSLTARRSEQECRARQEIALDTCRFLVVCVYLWSGIQKANWTFLHDIFPWMVGPVTHLLPHLALAKAAPAVPIIEFATGFGLLTVRLRPYAVAAALAMHAFILTCLGPWGLDWNSVVWPWNVAMMLFVLLFFARDRTPFLGRFLKACVSLRRSFIPALALLLFGVMPLFSFFGLWDSYLSLTLYSGDTRHASLSFSPRELRRLPPVIQRYAVSDGSEATLDLSDWSNGELNVPPYPEMRIYRSVAKSICDRAENRAEVQLVVDGKPNWRTGTKQTQTYPCTER